MRYRKLGRTELSVSEIGFGTWGVGGEAYGNVDDYESKAALKRAFELGINFYDTADIYGHGKSERLIANSLECVRKKIIIVSKVGYVQSTTQYDFQLKKQNFSPLYIKHNLKSTIDRLNTDYVDIYLLHSPPTHIITNKEVCTTLRHIKKSGRAKYIGVSLRSIDDGFVALENGMYDVLELIYNLVYQRPMETYLLKKCYESGIGLIIKSPLSHGFLTGKYKFPPKFLENDHRTRWSNEQIQYWTNALALYSSIWKDKKWSYTQAALKFCLSTPYVSTVIPGMKTVLDVEENISVADGKYFSHDELNKIKSLYLGIKKLDPLRKNIDTIMLF